MKVTLMRHGEVEEAYRGCYNGHNEIHLSCHGKEQSQKRGRELAHKDFDAIFCSDLLRAKETLEAMWQSLFDGVEVKYCPELREKSWGRHEGMRYEEICASEGLVYNSFYEWIEALDGERVEVFEKRVKEFFFEQIIKSEKKSLLVVTHAGVIAVIRSFKENISLEEAFFQNINYSDYVTLCF